MQLPMKLCACLMLLSAAYAGLVEDQVSGLQRCPSLTYAGHRLRCFQHGDVRIVQPPIALHLTAESRVRPDPFGNGFYLLVPLQITHDIRLPPSSDAKWHVLDVQRFKVEFSEPQCPSKCPKVTVSGEWRQNDTAVVRFRCETHQDCTSVLRSLRFTGERSRSVRASLRFTFYGTANGVSYAMSRIGLPIDDVVAEPLRQEFWFEGDKLMLFTIKANIGMRAFDAYQSELSYTIPSDGSLPDVYRSNLVDNLAAAASTAHWEIVTEMRKAGKTVLQVVFSADPTGLNKNSWFRPERVVSSKPYWIGHSDFNYFSIQGHEITVHLRHFYINRSYSACTADMGIMTVADLLDVCPWVNQFWTGKAPALIYSAYDYTPLQGGSAQSADTFLIYMRLARTKAASAAPALPDAFIFEPNKLLLFTVAANSNNAAADTFLNSAIKHSVPADGRLPAVYRSELIDSLPTIFTRTGFNYIVAEMRVDNRMVAQVVFDISARRSVLNKENWFVRDRVVTSSPYPIGDGFNYFAIRGDNGFGDGRKRNFFISFVYNGCEGDRAFWLVMDNRDPCVYGNKHWAGRAPALIYTSENNRAGASLHGGAAKYDANRFLIYLM